MTTTQAKKPDAKRPRTVSRTPSVGRTALSRTQIDATRASLSSEIQALQEKGAAARHRLDQVHHSLFRGEPDEVDQSMGRIIFDEGVTLEEQAAARLESCRHALERIESGSYGTCETCQQTIDPRRLLAIPRATTCLTCAAGRSRHPSTR